MSEFDIEFLAQKMSENPRSPLFARLADLYLKKQQTTDAIKLCEDGIKLFPKYYAGYAILGKIHFELREYSKARLALEQGLSLSPFNEALKTMLASIPREPDQSSRTTDESYFELQTPVVPEIPIQHVEIPLPEEPEINLSEAAETIHEEQEIEVPKTTELPTIEEPQDFQQDQEVNSAPQSTRSFPSFDEFYTQYQAQQSNEEIRSLDEFLNENIPLQSSQQEESVINNNEQPIDAVLPSVEDEITPQQQHEEPEAVFSSPEQEQLFSGMSDEVILEEEKPAIEPKTMLDELADKLQNVERIVPQDNYQPPQEIKEEIPEEQSTDSEMVTPTLAEIYASQGEYGAAIQAYEILLFSQPGKTAEYQQRIRELQQKQMEKEGLL